MWYVALPLVHCTAYLLAPVAPPPSGFARVPNRLRAIREHTRVHTPPTAPPRARARTHYCTHPSTALLWLSDWVITHIGVTVTHTARRADGRVAIVCILSQSPLVTTLSSHTALDPHALMYEHAAQ